MLFSFLEGFKLAFGLRKSIWKESEEMAQFRLREVLALCLLATVASRMCQELHFTRMANQPHADEFFTTFFLVGVILPCFC